MLRRVLTLGTIVAVLLGAGAAVYLLVPVPLRAETLTHSLERETGSSGLGGECERAQGDRWRCTVSDAGGSGFADYLVTADGKCWEARRTSAASLAETPMPARAEGCTRLRDRYPLLD